MTIHNVCKKWTIMIMTVGICMHKDAHRIIDSWILKRLSSIKWIVFTLALGYHHTPWTYSLGISFPGRVRWRITSLFSGIECFREALHILDTAVASKFGFQLDFKYCLMVSCLDLLSGVWCNLNFYWNRTKTTCYYWGGEIQCLQQGAGSALSRHMCDARCIWSTERISEVEALESS